MITFNSISIKNFLSFGNVPSTINLDTNKSTLIIGNNRDVGEVGESKNGVGKSTIFQALTYAIYGESINDIKQDGLINLTNTKNMVVELCFTKDQDDFKIIRGRKPNILEFYKNSQNFTTFSSRTTDESILEVIGIDFDIFLNTIVLTNNISAFMLKKPAAQKEFLENIFTIKTLTQRADNIKVSAKENEVNLRLAVADLDRTKSNNITISKNILSLKEKSLSWVSDRDNSLVTKEKELLKLKSVDVSYGLSLFESIKSMKQEKLEIEEEIKKITLIIDNYNKILKNNTTINENLVVLTKKISDWDSNTTKKLEEIGSSIDELRTIDIKSSLSLLSKLKSLKDSVVEIDRKIQITTKKLEEKLVTKEKYEKTLLDLNSGQCPFCHQALTHEGHILSAENDLDLLESEIMKLTEQLEMDIQDKDKTHKEYDGLLEKNPNMLSEKEYLILENEIKSLEKELTVIEKSSNPFHSQHEMMALQIQELTANPNEQYDISDSRNLLSQTTDKMTLIQSEINNLPLKSEKDYSILETNIKNIEDGVLSLKSTVNPFIGQLEMMESQIVSESDINIKELQKLETHYKIMVKLLTDSKSYVRKSIITQYVPALNGAINTYLSRLASPHKIKINDDLSLDISVGGVMLGGFGSLSNGERLRVNLSMSLAFRDFLKSTGKNFNLLGVDELLDAGGDSTFMNNSIFLLKSLKLSTFIISHREELESKCDVMLVIEKNKGFSHVIIQ